MRRCGGAPGCAPAGAPQATATRPRPSRAPRARPRRAPTNGGGAPRIARAAPAMRAVPTCPPGRRATTSARSRSREVILSRSRMLRGASCGKPVRSSGCTRTLVAQARQMAWSVPSAALRATTPVSAHHARAACSPTPAVSRSTSSCTVMSVAAAATQSSRAPRGSIRRDPRRASRRRRGPRRCSRARRTG